MSQLFAFEFMRHAMAAALLSGIICGVIGTFVVVNRMVFLAGGIAHAAYGGVGIALYFGISFIAGTIGTALAAAWIMTAAFLARPARSDTVIGVIWAAGMALGIILVDLTPGYHPDLMAYLFGSILSVTASDLYAAAFITGAVICMTHFFYRDLLAVSYDPEFAQLRGVPVKRTYFLLFSMTALSVVLITRITGLILVIALISIPPAIAERFSKSLPSMMVISAILAIFFNMTGLYISYRFDITSGAAVTLAACIAYTMVMISSKLGWPQTGAER